MSGPTLPPLQSFAPLSPFPYETGPMDMLQQHPRGLHFGPPELDGGAPLPLLPALGNYLHDYDEQRVFQDPPPVAEHSTKKPRVDKRNTRPLTVEDLLHDNSRFAKVVKAFLSIEDQENRTVPEIAKRVSEMYAGQYADFEGVKVRISCLRLALVTHFTYLANGERRTSKTQGVLASWERLSISVELKRRSGETRIPFQQQTAGQESL